MIRYCFALAMFAALFSVPVPAEAQISRSNPYRSFNLSGVNYGSMQWERSHRRNANKAWSTNRSGGRLFRGR